MFSGRLAQRQSSMTNRIIGIGTSSNQSKTPRSMSGLRSKPWLAPGEHQGHHGHHSAGRRTSARCQQMYRSTGPAADGGSGVLPDRGSQARRAVHLAWDNQERRRANVCRPRFPRQPRRGPHALATIRRIRPYKPEKATKIFRPSPAATTRMPKRSGWRRRCRGRSVRSTPRWPGWTG